MEKAPEGARRANFDFPVVDKARAFKAVDAMRPIADQHQATVAQVALTWLLSRPQVSSVIIEAKTPDQLKDNLGASGFLLTSEDLQALEEVSKLPPEYPGWMLAMQGQYRAVPCSSAGSCVVSTAMPVHGDAPWIYWLTV